MRAGPLVLSLSKGAIRPIKPTGISQPALSRLLRGHFRDMSADRLIRALVRLGSEVEIGVSRGGEAVGAPIHLEAVAA